jgi:hypothetical protein
MPRVRVRLVAATSGRIVGLVRSRHIANLVVADTDLLETRTTVRYLFIDGRQVSLESRHTDLYDAFKNRR